MHDEARVGEEGLTGTERAGGLGDRQRSRWGRGGSRREGSAPAAARRSRAGRRTAALSARP
jgi:hypothetical protein